MLNYCKGLVSIALLAAVAVVHAADLPFRTIRVAYEGVAREQVFDGSVEAVDKATLSAQTTGRIAQIYYDVDEFVPQDAGRVRGDAGSFSPRSSC
jgi:multidrug efflux pump subunit AcrA (membrane-fusion protein)